jgi:hypothetical protein
MTSHTASADTTVDRDLLTAGLSTCPYTGTYRLKNQDSGLFLAADATARANVELGSSTASNIIWLRATVGTDYSFTNQATGRVLRMEADVFGANVNAASSNQVWKIVNISGSANKRLANSWGNYTLYLRASGSLAGTNAAVTSTAATNTEWLLETVPTTQTGCSAGNCYKLKSALGNIYLRDKNSLSKDVSVITSATADLNQRWTFVNGGSGWCALQNVGSGLYLRVLSGTATSGVIGANVDSHTTTLDAASKWQLDQFIGGWYGLRSQKQVSGTGADKALYARAAGSSSGATVEVSNASDAKALWQLVPVP